ncbi:hypothetical protein E2C01_071225 [Portunus trituberculatus]|uniref:Uncharacterized protein n=1 Tax=Portunus trituberculatus TaxID=210409 RepID=A0A5B7I3F0_PORTR|nr:hypothetical protein [Portunus trituberculatus]
MGEAESDRKRTGGGWEMEGRSWRRLDIGWEK